LAFHFAGERNFNVSRKIAIYPYVKKDKPFGSKLQAHVLSLCAKKRCGSTIDTSAGANPESFIKG
jgi:hypothetical protein